MGMMQVPIHQVVDVIPVGYSLMTAVHAVSVGLIMTGTFVAWRAFLRIFQVYLDAVVVHLIAMGVVQVPIVKVVNVAIVLHIDVRLLERERAWPAVLRRVRAVGGIAAPHATRRRRREVRDGRAKRRSDR